MPPELNEVMDVRCGSQQEKVTPFIEADGQRAILVHSERQGTRH